MRRPSEAPGSLLAAAAHRSASLSMPGNERVSSEGPADGFLSTSGQREARSAARSMTGWGPAPIPEGACGSPPPRLNKHAVCGDEGHFCV